MSTDLAVLLIYGWLVVFLLYVCWLFWTAWRKGGPKW